MDAQMQPEGRSVSKEIDSGFTTTISLLIVNLLFIGYILSNLPNHFKATCAVCLSALYTLLLQLKRKVLQLEVDQPLEALKWRRLCICVVYAVSMVFQVFGFLEDMDRISRSFLQVGSRLMVLVSLILHCSFGEFEAVMDSLPGAGKELKGKQRRRVITHVISFTPICGIFLLTSVGDPWKLAYVVLSYLLAFLMAFCSGKATESRLESLFLWKMWRRAKSSSLITYVILNLVVICHIQPAVYMKNFLCKSMCGFLLMIVIAHVVSVELEIEKHFERKEKRSDNGEDTGVPVKITDDEREGQLIEILLSMLILSNSGIVVGLP